jgi:hypothetical protein
VSLRRPSLRRWTVAVAAALIGLAALAPTAGAARRWHPIATGAMNISDQVGLARTRKVLHVVWRRNDGTTSESLRQRPIAPTGAVGPAVTVLRGWASVGSPALVATNTGRLAAFFGGTRTLVTGDPTFGLDLATSDDSGATWTAGAAAVARNDFASSRTPAATVTYAGAASEGPLLQAWYGADQSVVHSDLDPNVPAAKGYGVGTDQAIVGFSIGKAELAWCETGKGVYVAGVDPATGARTGRVIHLPDTGRCPADTRVALTTLGIQTEYVSIAASSASGRRVRVFWIRRGAIVRTFTIAGGSSFKQEIAQTGNRSSRSFWAAWRDSDSDRIVLRHYRVGGTWGAKVTIPLPKGQSLSQLNLDAQRDRVDLVARTSDDDNVVHLYSAQSFPGLTLAKTKRRGVLRVLEAGRPVPGATVRVAGRKVASDGTGRAAFNLPAGVYRATATKTKFVKAALRFRIRKR